MTCSSARSWRPTGPTRPRRPAARFLLDREADPNLITRDVGRLFLGMDLQCCQCHDHPLIDGYKQQHYYGLYAFVSRTVLIGGKEADGTIKPGSVAVLGEKAEGDVTFSSVFKKKVTHKTGPRVLEGHSPTEPATGQGPGVPGPPRQGRQGPPGAGLQPPGPAGPEPDLARIAGFRPQHRQPALGPDDGPGHRSPVDLHHDDNPPSNPELLDLLASELVAMKYDIKAFLRELALTRAYERSSEPPPDASPELAEPRHFAVAALAADLARAACLERDAGRRPAGGHPHRRGVAARRGRPADEGDPRPRRPSAGRSARRSSRNRFTPASSQMPAPS